MNKIFKHIPVICGIIFLLMIIISVGSAWASGVHLYDLGISFSAYVGLSRTISAIYFCAAVVMISLLAYYVAKTKMPLIKRIIYAVILTDLFGTAFFPYNFFSEAPTARSINWHNNFAICMMLASTVLFIITAFISKSKTQRAVSIISIIYSAAFIVMYFLRFGLMFRTFFIWENLFIVLLLLAFQTEQNENATIESETEV
jgi:hypothetical protein